MLIEFVNRISLIFLLLCVYASHAQNRMKSPLVGNFNLDDDFQQILESSSENSVLKKVVSINNGLCTGTLIDENGLVLSNYHCFYSQMFQQDPEIQTNGFCTDDPNNEIKLDGIEIEILKSNNDITKEILSSGRENIKAKTDSILQILNSESSNRFIIKKFEAQDIYLLLEFEIYSDISLVCAPPYSIANYGGKKSNWQWPRYAMDFIILRINDLQSKTHFFKSSENQIQENMRISSLGFPFRTNRNSVSSEIEYRINFENRIRSLVRDSRLFILEEESYFRSDLPDFYLSQKEDIENYNQLIKGESEIISSYNYLEDRILNEENLTDSLPKLNLIYDSLQRLFEQLKIYSKPRLFLNEALVAPQIFMFSFSYNQLYEQIKNKVSDEEINTTIERLKSNATSHFKNYDAKLDEKIFYKMIVLYDKSVEDSLKSTFFKNARMNFDGDLYLYSKNIYQKSIFGSKEKCLKLLEAPTLSLLESDPAFDHSTQIVEHYFTQVAPNINYLNNEIEKQYNELFKILPSDYIDANGTIMFSSGKILGYNISGAINYDYSTGFDNWKIDRSSESGDLPDNFIKYLENTPTKSLCFIGNLDVSSGNSGSPVLDENGELIGLIFDQNFYGMSNQYFYDPKIQRAICLDIKAIKSLIQEYFGIRDGLF